jgi:alpha-N-acetylglucosamine transferase
MTYAPPFLGAVGLTNIQRIILIDSDMIMFQNIDELFDLPLAEGQIAATYVCACNPRKKPYFPSDWCVYCP